MTAVRSSKEVWWPWWGGALKPHVIFYLPRTSQERFSHSLNVTEQKKESPRWERLISGLECSFCLRVVGTWLYGGMTFVPKFVSQGHR